MVLRRGTDDRQGSLLGGRDLYGNHIENRRAKLNRDPVPLNQILETILSGHSPVNDLKAVESFYTSFQRAAGFKRHWLSDKGQVFIDSETHDLVLTVNSAQKDNLAEHETYELMLGLLPEREDCSKPSIHFVTVELENVPGYKPMERTIAPSSSPPPQPNQSSQLSEAFGKSKVPYRLGSHKEVIVHDGIRQAASRLEALANNLDSPDKVRPICLVGPNGSGKSALISKFMHYLFEKGILSGYLNMNAHSEELRKTFNTDKRPDLGYMYKARAGCLDSLENLFGPKGLRVGCADEAYRLWDFFTQAGRKRGFVCSYTYGFKTIPEAEAEAHVQDFIGRIASAGNPHLASRIQGCEFVYVNMPQLEGDRDSLILALLSKNLFKGLTLKDGQRVAEGISLGIPADVSVRYIESKLAEIMNYASTIESRIALMMNSVPTTEKVLSPEVLESMSSRYSLSSETPFTIPYQQQLFEWGKARPEDIVKFFKQECFNHGRDAELILSGDRSPDSVLLRGALAYTLVHYSEMPLRDVGKVIGLTPSSVKRLLTNFTNTSRDLLPDLVGAFYSGALDVDSPEEAK
ncbi:Uncharacterised protein [uncultured archaeon]|nr:Uncharacterised protein [uncultured archaeon]